VAAEELHNRLAAADTLLAVPVVQEVCHSQRGAAADRSRLVAGHTLPAVVHIHPAAVRIHLAAVRSQADLEVAAHTELVAVAGRSQRTVGSVLRALDCTHLVGVERRTGPVEVRHKMLAEGEPE
jgi:hypothetical protein